MKRFISCALALFGFGFGQEYFDCFTEYAIGEYDETDQETGEKYVVHDTTTAFLTAIYIDGELRGKLKEYYTTSEQIDECDTTQNGGIMAFHKKAVVKKIPAKRTKHCLPHKKNYRGFYVYELDFAIKLSKNELNALKMPTKNVKKWDKTGMTKTCLDIHFCPEMPIDCNKSTWRWD